MKKRLFYILIVAICCVHSITAQTFPVTVVPQTVPPAPIYLSSYADASTINSPLRVQIILNDFAQLNREIRLKTFFEGNGIQFESNDVVVGAPNLFLEGGVPLNLTNVELAPYFAFENISGIAPSTYGQPIPEGSYQFCFEVYDVLSGVKISQRSCASTFIFQNEPPLLLAPNNREDLREQNPLNLLFQWTPRHINVTNVQYELSIVEIWDLTIDPQAAFLASPPIFQTTTTNTSYLYSAIDPLLLSNKRYAWRVQAQATNGSEEIGLFNNNGFSEIFWFNYTAPCEKPTTVSHEVKGAQQVNINWEDFTTSVPEFTIRYREEGQDNEWFYTKTTANWTTIWDLQAGTTYEYQVNKNCLISESDYSVVQTFTTLTEDDEAGLVDCGISPDLDIENMEPLEQLLKGNTFTAGDFPIKVTESNGQNGRFTGKGYVTFPYFNSIKVAVNFTNVFINNDNELAEGTVVTVYDPSWGNILDIDEVIDVGEDIIDVFTGGDDVIVPQLDYDIDENDINITDGQIVITKPDGTQQTIDYDEGDRYTITDASGDVYSVDKDGNITQTGEGDTSPQLTTENTDGIQVGSHAGTIEDFYVNAITNNDVAVTFRTNDDTRFALDLANNTYETNNYPKITASSGDYYPPHKAVVQGETDVFFADIEINNADIKIDSLIIKTIKNTAIKHERVSGTNTYKITVTGANPYLTQECVVTYKDPDSGKFKIAASFFIHHLVQQKEVPVQVVTVNGGNNISNLETGLNDIFGLAGGRFKVKSDVINITMDQDAWDTGDKNGIIDYDGSGLLSDYPTELKNIYKEFKKQYPRYDSRQYFIFVLGDEFRVSKPLNGFMPKTRQWGFVFERHLKEQGIENKSSPLLVAAHELGHGVFTLAHPFGDNVDNAGQASTWLMDYGDGTELGYPNWVTMNDSDLNLFLFQDDSGGELAGEVWFTPEWEPISIARSSIVVTTSKSSQVKGALPGFKSKGIRYTALFSSTGEFVGYHEDGKANGKKYEIDPINKKDIEKVYLFVKGENNCNKAYETTYEYAIANTTSIVYDSSNTNIKDSNRIRCAECPEGKQFIEDYINTVSDSNEKEAIELISGLICAEGDDQIDYDILVAQINKDFSDQLSKVFWGSDKAFFVRARNMFWDQEGAFAMYLRALLKVNQNIESYNEQLGSNVSKEEFYSALYYLNDSFIGTLTYEQKEKLLETIFEHNIFITEGFFVDGKSDVSLIKKVIQSIEDNNLDVLLDKIVDKTFTPDSVSEFPKREVLFEIVDAIEFDRLKNIDIKIKVEALSRMLDGNIFSLFGTKFHYKDVITKLIKSVKNDEAAAFLSSLEDPTKSFDEKPLVYHLKTRLTDFFTNSDAYTAFFKEINRLCAERSIVSPNEYGIKAEISWKVENRDYVLLSFVRDKNDYKYVYDETTHKVQLLTCKNTIQTRRGIRCAEEINLLEGSGSPFDMVMVYFYENASPFSPVVDTRLYDEPALEAKGHIIPAMFLEYMYGETGEEVAKNFGWNTFNVVITVATLGEGAAAISAVRIAASSGTKILFRTILRQSYSLIDLSLTVGGTAYQFGAGNKLPKSFEYVGYFLAAKTTFDLLNGGLKGLATIDNASAVQKQKYLDDLEILNNEGEKITLDEFDDLILKSKNLIRDNEHLSYEYRRILLELKLGVSVSKTSILAKLEGLTDPKILTFKDWINRLDDVDATLLDRIDKLGDDIVKFSKDFDFSNSTIISKFSSQPDLVKSWEVLKEFREIRIADGNIEVLLKVSDRFRYNNKSSFEGLTDLFNGSAASKQKLIDGLKKADELFDSSLPVTFSGVKRGEIIANIESTEDIAKVIDKNGNGDEVARFVDGVLKKKKFLREEGDVTVAKKGAKPEDDILKRGDEIGFRDIDNTINGVFRVFFKDVNDFARTFDKKGEVATTLRNEAFDLYKQGKWNELETLFKKNGLNGDWPPANGGFNIIDDVPIEEGQKFDRYGGNFGLDANGNPILGGSFTSPIEGEVPYRFGQRALNKLEAEYDFYYEIEVLKDLPFKAQNADVIPWFGQVGGGKQSMWKMPIDKTTGYPITWNKLAEEGYVKITIKDSPSGNFSNLKGIIIQE